MRVFSGGLMVDYRWIEVSMVLCEDKGDLLRDFRITLVPV